MADIFISGDKLAKQNDIDLLSGKQHLNVSDANDMTASGFHFISNHDGRHNYPTQSWGNMIISNGENHRIVQIFFPDTGNTPFYRISNEGQWTDWINLASVNQIGDLQSQINDLKKKVDSLTKNQNGGVTSLLSHIRQGLSNVASNRMEVA